MQSSDTRALLTSTPSSSSSYSTLSSSSTSAALPTNPPLSNFPLANVPTPESLRHFSILLDGFRWNITELEPGKIHAVACDPNNSRPLACTTIPFSVEQQQFSLLRKRKRSAPITSNITNNTTHLNTNSNSSNSVPLSGTISHSNASTCSQPVLDLPHSPLATCHKKSLQSSNSVLTSQSTVPFHDRSISPLILPIEPTSSHVPEITLYPETSQSSPPFSSSISFSSTSSGSTTMSMPIKKRVKSADLTSGHPPLPTTTSASASFSGSVNVSHSHPPLMILPLSRPLESSPETLPPSPIRSPDYLAPDPFTPPSTFAVPEVSTHLSASEATRTPELHSPQQHLLQPHSLIPVYGQTDTDNFSSTCEAMVIDPMTPSSRSRHSSSPLSHLSLSPSISASPAPYSLLPNTSVASASSLHIPFATLQQLPSLLLHYDQLPEQLQHYMLFQLLRRSSVSSLHLISNLVQPALKRDFISLLPYEITMNILYRLDPKTLCRGARVSSRWRQLIDGDARLWKLQGYKEGLWGPDGISTTLRLRNPMLIQALKQYAQQYHPWATDWSDYLNPDAFLGLGGGVPSYLPGLPLATPHPFKHMFQRSVDLQRNWMLGKHKTTSFVGHANAVVTCLQFDDEKIVSGSDDQTICIYDIHTGKLLRTLEGHDGGVWALQYVGNTLVSGSTDRTVRVWDLSTGKTTHIFKGHTSTVRCLQILSPVTQAASEYQGYMASNTCLSQCLTPLLNEPLIVTGSRDATLRVWRLPDPTLHPKEEPPCIVDDTLGLTLPHPYFRHVLLGHDHSVRALAGHGHIVCSGSYDATVRVWDVVKGECRWRLVGHTQKVYSIVFDGQTRCWSGSMDATIRCWDITTGQCLALMEGHTSLVGLLELTPQRLVSAAADSTLRIWDLTTNRSMHVLQAHHNAITCFQFDRYKVVSGSEGAIKLWNPTTGTVVRDLVTRVSNVWRLQMNERWCVAAVNRNDRTEFVVLDFDVLDEELSQHGEDEDEDDDDDDEEEEEEEEEDEDDDDDDDDDEDDEEMEEDDEEEEEASMEDDEDDEEVEEEDEEDEEDIEVDEEVEDEAMEEVEANLQSSHLSHPPPAPRPPLLQPPIPPPPPPLATPTTTTSFHYQSECHPHFRPAITSTSAPLIGGSRPVPSYYTTHTYMYTRSHPTFQQRPYYNPYLYYYAQPTQYQYYAYPSSQYQGSSIPSYNMI